jgi:hypothetical protein
LDGFAQIIIFQGSPILNSPLKFYATRIVKIIEMSAIDGFLRDFNFFEVSFGTHAL